MGLFNDNENLKADHIFMNGQIYTEDENLPWADAVACKYGEIIAVGKYSEMKDLEDEYTEITDLKEKFMFPGFIDAHSATVLSVFNNTYTALDPSWDSDTVMGELSGSCYDNFDNHAVFGYGFNTSVLKEYETEEKRCSLLDEMEAECPVILLASDGMTLWYNTICRDRLRSFFNREDISGISPVAVLKALEIFDEEELESNFEEETERLTDRGYTTVLDYDSPLCFNRIYMDLFSDGKGDIEKMDQTFYSSVSVNRPVSPEELEKLSGEKCEVLKINASEETFSSDDLRRICLDGAEKGFNIYLDALDRKTLYSAYEAFQLIREKGMSENNLVLASDLKLTEEEKENFSYRDTFVLTFASDTLNASVFSHCSSVHDAVDQLTVKAAEILGMSDSLGSIEKGKTADFTVFSEDIFAAGLRTFPRLHSDMIVSGGEIIYDVDEENFDEMVNLLMNMQM